MRQIEVAYWAEMYAEAIRRKQLTIEILELSLAFTGRSAIVRLTKQLVRQNFIRSRQPVYSSQSLYVDSR